MSHDSLNVFLDRYGVQLADAYFVDFEMVGKGTIHFIQQHHGAKWHQRTDTLDQTDLQASERVAQCA